MCCLRNSPISPSECTGPSSTPLEGRSEHSGPLHPNDDMCPHPANHGAPGECPAIQLLYLRTDVDVAQVRDLPYPPKTLALSKWTDGTIGLWIGYLQPLERSALLWHVWRA